MLTATKYNGFYKFRAKTSRDIYFASTQASSLRLLKTSHFNQIFFGRFTLKNISKRKIFSPDSFNVLLSFSKFQLLATTVIILDSLDIY